jgi:hypothetical protein
MRAMQSRSAQAESYLEQAIDSLRSAGDPGALWSDAGSMYAGGLLEHAARGNDAGNRRLRFLRASVIFAALAAEAYANGFLAEHLTEAEVEAVDRLPTIDKLLTGPKHAGLESPLDPGREPVQTLRELFHSRNRLVHPRRDEHGAYLQYLNEEDEKIFGPPRVGRYILAVTQTIAAMEAICRGRSSMAGTSLLLSGDPAVIEELVASIGPTIGSVIQEDDPRPPCPIEEAQRRRTARARREAPPETG